MGMFTDMYMELQDIKRQGFDATKELFGDKMKGKPPAGSSMALSKSQDAALRSVLRKYDSKKISSSTSYYVPGEDGYKLKPDKVSLVMENPEKSGVSSDVIKKIKKTREGDFLIPDRPTSSGLPEKFYQKGAVTYDALTNTSNSFFTKDSPVVQETIQQGRKNLEYTIENIVPEETLKQIGITREQAKSIIPTD